MAKFDRARQRRILEQARDQFPQPVSYLSQENRALIEEYLPDLNYLAGHGLINLEAQYYGENDWATLRATITSKGIDFLEDDGGLGAILGVVTIKLHEETLRQLIETKILKSNLPQTQKKRLIDQLRALPAETTKHLAMQLVDAGLKNWPAALQLLQTALS